MPPSITTWLAISISTAAEKSEAIAPTATRIVVSRAEERLKHFLSHYDDISFRQLNRHVLDVVLPLGVIFVPFQKQLQQT